MSISPGAHPSSHTAGASRDAGAGPIRCWASACWARIGAKDYTPEVANVKSHRRMP